MSIENKNESEQECPPGEICIINNGETLYIEDVGKNISDYIRVTLISLLIGGLSYAISVNIFQIVQYVVELNMPPSIDFFWVLFFSLAIIIVIFIGVVVAIWFLLQITSGKTKKMRIRRSKSKPK
jgi:hypothetical protein